MNGRLVERILVGILLVIAAGIVVHAPLTVYLGTIWPQWDQVIKAWKEILMGVALVLLIIVAVKRKMARILLDDRLMQLALVYAGLHLVMMSVFQNGLQFAGAGLLIDLRYILFFVLVYGTIKLLPNYRTLFIRVFAGGAVVVLGFALLQVFVLPRDILAHIGYTKATIAPFLTVDENSDYIRINSTLRGPNPLGAYAVIVLSAVLAISIKYKRKLSREYKIILAVFAASAGLVLGVSYSRSSLVGFLVAVIVTVASVSTVKVRKQLGIVTIIGIVITTLFLVIARNNPYISNVVLHDNPTSGSAVDSNSGHATSLIDGFKNFVVQPLGSGVGSTGSASLGSKNPLIIENQYLFIAHEVGWAGIVLFIWIFVEIMRRLWARKSGAFALATFASGCGLAVIGLLLPVWVDDTVSIIWWGMAAVAIGSEYHGRKSN